MKWLPLAAWRHGVPGRRLASGSPRGPPRRAPRRPRRPVARRASSRRGEEREGVYHPVVEGGRGYNHLSLGEHRREGLSTLREAEVLHLHRHTRRARGRGHTTVSRAREGEMCEVRGDTTQHGQGGGEAGGRGDAATHLGRRVAQHVQEHRDALLRVGVHRLPRRARRAQLQQPREEEHHVRRDEVCHLGREMLARAQRQLRQRRRHHGRQEVVSAQQHPPQLGRPRLARRAAAAAAAAVAAVVRALLRIRAVRKHHRPPLRLGRGRRRLGAGGGLVGGGRVEGQLAQAVLRGGRGQTTVSGGRGGTPAKRGARHP